MFVLASKSPRRKTILESMQLEFKIIIPDVEEHVKGIYFPDIPILNARMKADAVAVDNTEDIVLAADTVVEFDGQHFNKPADKEDAIAMLLTLSGQEHRVVTGVCLQKRSENIFTMFADISKVRFKKYSRNNVIEYMQKVNVMDKAGAYAVQEHGSMIIDEINGSVTNVMGLPSEKLQDALKVFSSSIL